MYFSILAPPKNGLIQFVVISLILFVSRWYFLYLIDYIISYFFKKSIQKVTQNKNTIEQQIKSQLIPFNKFYTSKLKINIPISETHIVDIKETEQIENADINTEINKEENEETIKESTKKTNAFLEALKNSELSNFQKNIFRVFISKVAG